MPNSPRRRLRSYRLRRTAMLVSALLLAGAGSRAAAADYDVFLDADQTRVVRRHDRVEVTASESASEAIQDALDLAAQSGGSVRLGSGRYRLDHPLTVGPGVRLAGSGRSTKLIVPPENAEGVAVVCPEAHAAEVADLCLSAGDNAGARAGLILDGCGDAKVRNVSAVGFADYGVWVRNHAFLCEVRGCTLAGNGKANLYLQDLHAGPVGNFIPNLVTNCTIYGGGKGIECDHVIVLNLVGCVIYHSDGCAIHLHSQSNSVLVSGCRTFQITGDAVVVEGNTHELNVTGNIFCWSTGHGIVVRHGAWGTITGNNVIDVGSFNPGGPNFESRFADVREEMPLKSGIVLFHTRGYTVTGNAVFNWNLAPKMRHGIHEDASSFKNVISGNTVNYTAEQAVLVEGAESVSRNNVSLAEVTHAEIGRLDPAKAIPGTYKADGFIQTFQPELTREFIEGLK